MRCSSVVLMVVYYVFNSIGVTMSESGQINQIDGALAQMGDNPTADQIVAIQAMLTALLDQYTNQLDILRKLKSLRDKYEVLFIQYPEIS